MKKLTIFLFSLVISINSYSGVFIEKNNCFEIDGQNIVFLPNDTTPYTGIYLCKFDNGQKKKEGSYKNGDYEITANGINYRGKWKTLNNEICYKQSNWVDYKCALVYLGFNDGVKLYFVEKVGRGAIYVAGIIYEEIY